MAYRSYSHLIVWQRAMELAVDVYKLTSGFPRDERYGLTSQLRRAVISIPANIAEGYGRSTRGEYLNQLSVARGSTFEVETLCTVSGNLSYASPAQCAHVLSRTNEIQRMLARLRARLQG